MVFNHGDDDELTQLRSERDSVKWSLQVVHASLDTEHPERLDKLLDLMLDFDRESLLYVIGMIGAQSASLSDVALPLAPPCYFLHEMQRQSTLDLN